MYKTKNSILLQKKLYNHEYEIQSDGLFLNRILFYTEKSNGGVPDQDGKLIFHFWRRLEIRAAIYVDRMCYRNCEYRGPGDGCVDARVATHTDKRYDKIIRVNKCQRIKRLVQVLTFLLSFSSVLHVLILEQMVKTQS